MKSRQRKKFHQFQVVDGGGLDEKLESMGNMMLQFAELGIFNGTQVQEFLDQYSKPVQEKILAGIGRAFVNKLKEISG